MFNFIMLTLGYVTFGLIVGCAIDGAVIVIKEYCDNRR